MARLVCHIRPKVASNNAMPCGIVFFVELLLDVSSNILSRETKERRRKILVRHKTTTTRTTKTAGCKMSKWLLTAFEISGGGNSIKYQASKRPSTPPNQQPQHLVGVFFGCWQTYKPPNFCFPTRQLPPPLVLQAIGL